MLSEKFLSELNASVLCYVNIGTIHKEVYSDTVQEPVNVIYEQNRRVVGSCIYKV